MLVCLSQIIVTAIVCLQLLDMTATSNATVNNLGADIFPPPHFIVAISRLGFPDGPMVKNPPVNAGYARANGNPLQYSCLGNSMDRGAWLLQSMGKQSQM